jgi:hypothetical protein
MAWISLIVVALIFFTPILGIAPQVMGKDLTFLIHLAGVSVAFPIPGSGPLRLLLECAGLWLLLWLLLYLPDRWLGEKALVEKKPYSDFLTIKRMEWLWNDFVKSFRPSFSSRLAVQLAKLVIFGILAAFVLGYLLQLALDSILPLVVNFLVSQFGAEFVSLLQTFLGQAAQELVHFGMNENGIALLVLSALVLAANWFFEKEQQYRYNYAVQQRQNKARIEQKEIVIPAAQQ